MLSFDNGFCCKFSAMFQDPELLWDIPDTVKTGTSLFDFNRDYWIHPGQALKTKVEESTWIVLPAGKALIFLLRPQENIYPVSYISRAIKKLFLM